MYRAQNYDGLPPEGAEFGNRRPDRLSEAVADICFELSKIAQGSDVAYLTSCVIARFQGETSSKQAEQIRGEQRDRLLCGVALARPFILDCFPFSRDLDYACEGVDALSALVRLWGEAPEVRATRPVGLHSVTHARARWLRNACHNICLREEIEERREPAARCWRCAGRAEAPAL